MKVQRFILWIALFAAAATGLWSCTQEMDGPGTTDPDKTEGIAGYIGIRLKNSDATALGTPSTKAATIDGNFDPGEEDERAISPDPAAHALLMFDADGNWFGSTTIEMIDEKNLPIEGTYMAQINFEDGRLPEKLLAVINADPEFLKGLKKYLEDRTNDQGFTAMQAVLQYLTKSESAFYTDQNGKRWFTMTSSVYGDRENDNRILAAVPYDETPLSDYIFTNEEDILKNPLTLYVERVVAKFTVYFTQKEGQVPLGDAPIFFEPTNGSKVQYLEDWTASEAGAGQEEAEEVSWKVHIVNWGINAVEPNTFLFKNLSNTLGGGKADGSFSDEFWWNTFSPKTLPRSYWAVDPHYDAVSAPFADPARGNEYPYQYRYYSSKADSDKRPTYEMSEGSESTQWALDYFSYDEILKADRKSEIGSRYGVENTFDPGTLNTSNYEKMKEYLDDNGHLRVGTHIILAAQLLIDGYDSDAYNANSLAPDNTISGVRTKYFDGALFLSEEAMVKRSVYSLANQLFGKGYNGTASIDGKFYVNTGTSEEPYYEEISYDKPEEYTYVMNLFTTVPAYIEGGDGWATIGLTEGKTVYIKTDETSEPFELDAKTIKGLVYDLIEPVRAFTEGKMYYAIPVLHEKQFDANGKFDASNLHIGDVGVVRNHWYRVTVGSINTLGTPVHRPEQPIIPNHEPEFRSLGVQIEILPWSVIRLDDTIL